jgi:hypothetical protein
MYAVKLVGAKTHASSSHVSTLIDGTYRRWAILVRTGKECTCGLCVLQLPRIRLYDSFRATSSRRCRCFPFLDCPGAVGRQTGLPHVVIEPVYSKYCISGADTLDRPQLGGERHGWTEVCVVSIIINNRIKWCIVIIIAVVILITILSLSSALFFFMLFSY